MPDPVIYLRDATLARVAILEDFDKLQLKLRWADTSTWVLDVTGPNSATDLLQSNGCGIVVTRGDEVLLSGEVQEWTEQLDGDTVTFTFSGFDDTVRLTDRITTPTFTAAAPSNGYDTQTGNAEDVILNFLRWNLTGGEDPSRADPSLRLAPTGNRGPVVTLTTRYDELLLTVQSVALRAGDWGFRIYQPVGQTTLLFELLIGRDLSGTVLFNRDLGNLAKYVLSRKRATGTVAYVGGQGDLQARNVQVVVDGAAASNDRRREFFLDQRQAAASDELVAAGREALTKVGATLSVALTPLDTDAVMYGRDYQLGDLVTVQGFTAVVREIDLTFAPGQLPLVEPLIGDPGALNPKFGLAMVAARRRTDSRLSHLEGK